MTHPDPQQGIEVPIEPLIKGEWDGPVASLNLELPGGRRVNANLIVDTGSTEGLLLHTSFVEKYSLQHVKPQTADRLAYGGKFGAMPGLVSVLMLGDLRVEDLQTFYAGGPAASKPIDGEIGYKILSRLRIFVDAPHHVVVFEPVLLVRCSNLCD